MIGHWRVVMHRFMLLVGMGYALLAAPGCADAPMVPLALVAARNAVDTVRQLLAEGHQPDERDADGLTPLMWAARNGAVEAMTALLDAGADPNARDTRNGWTPLLHAIHTQRVDAVRLLLERGADPNARLDSTTPLMMAAVEIDPSFVKLLLEYGADPQARGYGGATALSLAVSGGALSDIDRPLLGGCRTETVRVLKTHDPKMDMPDTIAGWHALWWARFHGCHDVLNMVGPSGLRTNKG
jgi:ankyrin repeat protein